LKRLAAFSTILLAGALTACELAEVTIADSAPTLVVEAVLRADLRQQRILLHRAIDGGVVAGEPGASVRVVDESTGREYRFRQARPDEIDPCANLQGIRLPADPTCYLSVEEAGSWVRPGRTYRLLISTSAGLQATGRTTVPGGFRLASPPLSPGFSCSLEAGRALPLIWTQSAGAWAYLAELEIYGLREALGDTTITDIPARVRLTGLAISATDTTLVLPTEFGIFERTLYDYDLLLAIRDGLPAGAYAALTLAAVDRNFVNGVRGGDFNPSGRLRFSSVSGDAVGMFGSATGMQVDILVEAGPAGMPCLPG
jgi:hypothetical protein